jgi:hypothetical protein
VVVIPRETTAINRFYFGMNAPGGEYEAAAEAKATAVGKVRDNQTLSQPFRKPRWKNNLFFSEHFIPWQELFGFTFRSVKSWFYFSNEILEILKYSIDIEWSDNKSQS